MESADIRCEIKHIMGRWINCSLLLFRHFHPNHSLTKFAIKICDGYDYLDNDDDDDDKNHGTVTVTLP